MQVDTQTKKVLISPEHLQQVAQNILQYNIQEFELPDEMCEPFGISPHGIDNAIDLNRFLSCFPKLRLANGMILDYIYDCRPSYGDVLVYAREVADVPIFSTEQFTRAFSDFNKDDLSDFKWINPFIDSIIWEKSPEGFFDISLFLCYLKTIYLYDHGNYSYKQFLYTRRQIINWYILNNIVLNDIDTDVYYETSLPKSNCCMVSFLSESMYQGTQREQIIFVDDMPKFRKSETIIEPKGPTILY